MKGPDQEMSSTERTPAPRGSITLRDVAMRAGVSATTVSRILNKHDDGIPIRAETRQRVLALADEMGYKPNLLARGLRGSRSSLLGVIMRDTSDPFHAQILHGINAAATARDYRLFLGHVDYRPDVALTYGSMFERSHADGILMVGDIQGGEPALDSFAQHHHNVVGITDRTARLHFPGVYGDSVRGTALALEHLWGLGHRSIICVSNDRTADSRLRIDLYQQFMREHGAGESISVHVTDQGPAPSFELGLRILSSFTATDAPTAIYATTDTIAIGLVRAAFELGVSIPGQLSVIGFDDIDFSAYTIPPLTTVSQSGVEMGRIATELLLNMVEQGQAVSEVADVVLTPELVVRQSTAPPQPGRTDH